MQLLSSSTLLFFISSLALVPFRGFALPQRSDLRRAGLPELRYPENHNAATCPVDRLNTLSLSLQPDTAHVPNGPSLKKSSRAVIVPRVRSGALPGVCHQIASFFFPPLPYRYFRMGFPHLLPGNVYVLSIRTPVGKRIDEIAARVVVGTGPAQRRLIGITQPWSNVGTLELVVQARAEVDIGVVFQERNTPGELAIFALGPIPDPVQAWGLSWATVANA